MSISIFYFFVLFLISSVKCNIKLLYNKVILTKKIYAFIIVAYAYYLKINPNIIHTIISNYQLLMILYSIL